MSRLFALVMFAVLPLSGCVTNATLPNPSQESSIIAFTRDLRQITSTLLDKVVVALPNPTTDYPDYARWGGTWCPRHATVHSVSDVRRELAQYCQRVGGTYDSNSFCLRAADPTEVLFYAYVATEGDCQQVANPVGVRIIEPKPGRTRSSGYLAALHEVGYLLKTEVAHAEMERQRVAEEAQAQEQARLARELPLLRTRGTRVCNRQNGVLFAGYIEELSGPKVRISIHEAYFESRPGNRTRNPNFKPDTVWDVPEHWFVCD